MIRSEKDHPEIVRRPEGDAAAEGMTGRVGEERASSLYLPTQSASSDSLSGTQGGYRGVEGRKNMGVNPGQGGLPGLEEDPNLD